MTALEVLCRFIILYGLIRPDITTLVSLHDEEIKRGYQAGREFYFTEADSEQEWYWTEERLLQRLCELAQEYGMYQDATRTIRFSTGLSAQSFPSHCRQIG